MADRTVEGTTRAGFVALVGRPNAGKSTLLNALVGEHLAAVSDKVQTTRHRIPGFLTRDDTQIVFLDTPGLLDPRDPLQEAMLKTALGSVEGVDVIYFLADNDAPSGPETALLAALRGAEALLFLLLTKADRASAARLKQREEAWSLLAEWTARHHVSSLTGEGLESLLDATCSRLPLHPFFYEAEQLTDLSLRFLAAELVREACYEELSSELPYRVHVEVNEWQEAPEPGGITRIGATLYVERESQKGIVIGEGGRRLKAIGTRARASIETLLGGPVYLKQWVKVRPGWSRRDRDLRFFGYKP